MDNEFILYDRLEKIRQVVGKYGEENFYLSYSGGKDSTVLSELIDMALPGNTIPRVYADTGIEFTMIREFVYNKSLSDNRFVMIKPSKNIKNMLEEKGYPFKSKGHSEILSRYQRSGRTLSVKQYLGEREDKAPWSSEKSCPKILKYQFSEGFNLKVSDSCCNELKEKPLGKWKRENGKKYGIVGIMRAERGRRSTAVCLAFKGGKLANFQPLAPITKEWEAWFIDTYNISICDIYKPPFNFERTGCKGCPFCHRLQEELDTLEEFFPAEKKQCEYIWAPVYEEYRRIGYRLKREV